MMETSNCRLGIDLGGSKIEGLVMGLGRGRGQDVAADADLSAGRLAATTIPLARKRVATPRGDYDATIRAIVELVAALQQDMADRLGDKPSITLGVGIPGSISPHSGLVQNANSTWLNGRAFDRDLSAAVGLQVRCANDANCFALSEALDGAGSAARTVFGVILGTGCGGGMVRDKQLIDGPRGIAGEWGHNPLPWPRHQMHGEGNAAAGSEIPGPQCWCGRRGCMETWVSGPGLAADHARATGALLSCEEIARRASQGDAAATATLERHASRLARGLATVVNLFDPGVIVVGGGLSQMTHLYSALPALMAAHIFADDSSVEIRPPKWGDASGVRGAARLWDDTDFTIC